MGQVGVNEPSSSPSREPQTVTRSAGILVGGILSSRILGLLRDILLARWLSVDSRDVFVAAFRLPNVFRRILGEGAISAALVPVYVALSAEDEANGSRRADAFAGGVFGLLLAVASVVVGSGLIFMPAIMSWLLDGEAFLSVPGKLESTIALARIMFGFVAFATIYGWAASVLAGHRRFVAAAFAPCAFNLAMILGLAAAFFTKAPEDVIGYSVLVGGGLQAAIAVLALWRAKVSIVPEFTQGAPEVRRFFWRLMPGLVGLSVGQLTILVNMYFANDLGRGAQSYLYLTDRLLELPLSLFAVSLGSALLPVLSRQWAGGERGAFGAGVAESLRLLSFIAVPASLGLFVLAEPIASVLFEGAQFDAHEVRATASILRISALSLVFQSFARVLAQGLHATGDVKSPAYVAGFAFAVHMIAAWTLSSVWGLEGLAAAIVVSSALQTLVLWSGFSRKRVSLEGGACLRGFARHWISALVMVMALRAALDFVGNGASVKVSEGFDTLTLGSLIIGGVIIYAALSKILRVKEFESVMSMIKGKQRSPS